MKGLRYQRITHDLTQAVVAHHLKLTPSHYAKMERGEIQPKLKHLVSLAKLFECTIDNLCDGLSQTEGEE